MLNYAPNWVTESLSIYEDSSKMDAVVDAIGAELHVPLAIEEATNPDPPTISSSPLLGACFVAEGPLSRNTFESSAYKQTRRYKPKL
jgi:hypothetical protein